MVIVGIGEYAIRNEEDEVIITHALGSCVALLIHNPFTRDTALAHIVLPQLNRHQVAPHLQGKPAYYADIIVPKLMDCFLHNSGSSRNNLQIHLVGGADSLNEQDVFRVGMKNVTMIQSILRSYSVAPIEMDVGGNVSRTVQINVSDGSILVKRNNMIY
jgi:chemotaxis protein CheD